MIYDPSRSDPLLELGRRNFANQPSAQSPRQRHRHGCSRVTSQLCALCAFSLRASQFVPQRVHLRGASLQTTFQCVDVLWDSDWRLRH
jgi:hypothetical protein